MKKVLSKIVEFISDSKFLSFLWYIVYVMWFGFVGRMIIVSDQHIIVKILMLIGDVWWALYTFIHHYNSTDE